MDVATMRAAICKNRGGWARATDEEIGRMWGFLGEEVRAQYLKSIEAPPAPPLAVAAVPAESVAPPPGVEGEKENEKEKEKG